MRYMDIGRFDIFASLSFPDADLEHLKTCLAFFLWAFSVRVLIYYEPGRVLPFSFRPMTAQTREFFNQDQTNWKQEQNI